MNLNYYMPSQESFLLLDDKQVKIQGFDSIRFDCKGLKVFYKLFVDTSPDCQELLDAGGIFNDVINLRPLDMHLSVRLMIGSHRINSVVTRLLYYNVKHAYLLELTSEIDKKHIENYLFVPKNKRTKDANRFELMDIDE